MQFEEKMIFVINRQLNQGQNNQVVSCVDTANVFFRYISFKTANIG